MFVCIAGKNNIGVDVLEYLIENADARYELGVVCNKTETGVNSWQKSMRFFAKKYGIKEYKLDEIYEIRELIFISLEFDQIVKPELFVDAKLYNIHFSLLPAYKGMYTSAIPILNGEKYVGVTLHRIDAGIDTGDIIKQRKIELEPTCTCRDAYLQYISNGTELILECIEDILAGREKTTPQPAEGSTYYSKGYIDYSNIRIDLKQTATGIDRQIRAFSCREYQMPKVYDKAIISTKITNTRSQKKPGSVLSENEQGMILATVDYDIILYFDRFKELMEACCNGDYGTVKDICLVPEHINTVDEHGWSPLIVATYNNNVEIVKFLIAQGADVGVHNNNGTNLLMYAKDACINHKDNRLLKLFHDMGVSPDECDYAGKSLRDYLGMIGKTYEGLF